MPFKSPYRNDFQAGDLVYGLAAPRESWLKTHGALMGKSWIDKFKTNMKFVDSSDTANIDFITTTLEHPKYHSVIRTEEHEPSTATKEHAWRTKSKAGLNWAVTKKIHVHFILDKLNMKDVAKKSNKVGANVDNPTGKAGPDVSQENKMRTITNAELRWVYRNRNNPGTQDYIQFWLDDKPCCPPWEPGWDAVKPDEAPGHDAWNDYKPTKVA